MEFGVWSLEFPVLRARALDFGCVCYPPADGFRQRLTSSRAALFSAVRPRTVMNTEGYDAPIGFVSGPETPRRVWTAPDLLDSFLGGIC